MAAILGRVEKGHLALRATRTKKPKPQIGLGFFVRGMLESEPI
jgi:hypothetical protein